MRYLFLLMFVACGTYTDPQSERLTFYRCQGGKEVAVKVSDDYDSVTVRYREPPIVLYRYVTELEDGYRSESYIWRTKDKGSELIEINESGQARYLATNCRSSQE
jgi:membrane-bound inhibitor of C-type lysozyme